MNRRWDEDDAREARIEANYQAWKDRQKPEDMPVETKWDRVERGMKNSKGGKPQSSGCLVMTIALGAGGVAGLAALIEAARIAVGMLSG